MRRRFVLVLAVGLLVAACGGGGEDAAALSDAIADSLMENAGDDTTFEREQAECFGDEVVDRMGVDRLVAVGLSVEDIENGADPGSVDLSDEDIDAMTGAITACIDFGQLVVDGLAAEIALSDESASCLVDGINEADFLGSFAETFFLEDDIADDPAAAIEGEMMAALFSLLGDCLTADELGGFIGG